MNRIKYIFLRVFIFLILSLLIVCLFIVLPIIAPFLIYKFGISWSLLPPKSPATDQQLGFVYTFEQVLFPTISIPLAIWLLKTVSKHLLYKRKTSSSSSNMPNYRAKPPIKPQLLIASQNDPIIIGGGREKNEKLFWILLLEGIIIMFGGICTGDIGALLAPNQGLFSHDRVGYLVGFIVMLIVGGGLIFGGIAARPYGKRRQCLMIGSEGIDHYSVEKGSLFIPWDEMSRAYVDVHYLSSYLYIVLKSDSNLFYEESIKPRYEPGIGASGAIMICAVSKSSNSLIPKHLVEKTLQKYAPPQIL